MKNIIITGFTPFKDFTENPSGMLASEYSRPSKNIVGKVLPVDYLQANLELNSLLNTTTPKTCICMGLAKGDTFRLETLARKPEQYHNLPGKETYYSLIPEHISNFFSCQNQHFIISKDCGQYVCEATLWTLLNHANLNNHLKTAFFLHVPAISENWPYKNIKNEFEKILALITTTPD